MATIRISIVEDVAEIREGLRYIIDQTRDFACVSVFSSAEEALTGLAGSPSRSFYSTDPSRSSSADDPADIVVMDIALPGSSGLDCIRRLKAAGSGMQFIVFTIYEDSDQVFEALAAGASGYLLKDTSPDRIIAALHELYEGGSPMSATIARKVVSSFQRPGHIHELSPRETEILGLLSKGFLYKEIADRLHIAVGTVRQHIHRIYDKLHVQNRTEAINKAFGLRQD
ncbi:MAG: response regulator transcription factor [Bacteroidetes bacterium]|nr:response regulator transcription factor [Bacteroidota bacterium]